MFGDSHTIRMPVSITLVNGEKLNGCLLLGRQQKLLDVMNKPEPFIEFEARGGNLLTIAKSSIVSASLLDERKAQNGTEQLRRPEKFDAHEVLGLAKDAPPSAIRPAYVEKARLYHPDQFAAHPLPPEVIDYLETMFTAVRQAYEELSPQGDKTAA